MCIVLATLHSGAGGEGQLVEGQVPHLGECLPSWTPLEDPDEGVWSTNGRVVLHYSDAKEEKCDFELCCKCRNIILWESCTLHTIIIIQALHICYVMWIKCLSDSSSREMGLEWVWLWVQSDAVEACGSLSRASMQIDWVWVKFRKVELWKEML